MRLLTLCGSLRERSSNRAILDAFTRLAPRDATVAPYLGMGALPHFNPDLDADRAPPAVSALRKAIDQADAVIISTPEYAHGLPGAFKNLLDWLVGHPPFAGKPVVILHADRGSSWALDSLREVLRTMSANVIAGASVSLALGTNRLEACGILAREDLRSGLQTSITVLFEVLSRESHGLRDATAP